jgi:GT2 family glycosyltransferase/predicted nuclease with TOPRIM domain
MEIVKEDYFPKVSLVIPHYKGWGLIKRCISSLEKMDYPKQQLEIKVIDNCSPDASLRPLKKHFPQVEVIKNNENNYCKANNLGINHSTGAYIGFLNNDTVVDKNWLLSLVKVMEADKRIGCCGGKILLPDKRIQSTGHMEFPNFYWGDRGFREPDVGQYDIPEEIESLPGSALLFRKECLYEVGSFDEDFVMFMEDVDIFIRCRKSGWKIRYVPESVVYHKFHGTVEEKQVRFYIERNRLLLIAKHFPSELGKSLEGGIHSLSNEELFRVMPDIFLKYFKYHGSKSSPEQIQAFFRSLQHVYNFAKDKSIQELTHLVEESSQTRSLMETERDAVLHQVSLLTQQKLSLEESLGQRNKEAEILRGDLAQLQQQLEGVHSDISGLRAQNTALQSEREIFTSELKLQQGATKVQEDIILKLGEALERKYALSEELKKEIDERSAHLDKLTQQKLSLEESLGQRNKEAEILRGDLAQLQQQLEGVHSELKLRQEELVRLAEIAAAKEALEKTLEARNSDISGLRAQNTALQSEREIFTSELKLRQEELVRLAEIAAAKEALEKTLEARNSDISGLKANVVDLQTQIRYLEMEISYRLEFLEEIQQQRAALQKENEEFYRQVQEISERAKQLEIEKINGAFEKENLSGEIARATLRINEFENSMTDLRREIEIREGTIVSQKHLIEEAQGVLHQTQEKVVSLEREISNLTQELSLAKNETQGYKNRFMEKEDFIRNLFNSRTYRYLVMPFWRIMDAAKWTIGIKPKGVQTVLLVKPYYVSAQQTEEAIRNLRSCLTNARITLLANVPESDFDFLRHSVNADIKLLYSTKRHKLTAARFLKLMFMINLNYFSQAILLIGQPVYQGYRKGKLFLLFSGAKSLKLYFVQARQLAPFYPSHPFKQLVALFSYAASILSFVAVISFFFLAVVLPLKIRKLLRK